MHRKIFAPVELKLDEAGSISLAFAQLNVIDSDGDVTLPGAVPVKEVPMSAYGHGSWDGELPVGKGTIREAGDWAVFDGQFFMDTTAGRETHATIKALGPLAQYSYGYRPTDYSYGEQDGTPVRFLKRLDIFEVSPVLLGAGVGTHTLAIKSGGPDPDLPYAEHVAWMTDQVKALLDRSTDRAELRTKEGRTLSGATLDQLSAIHDGLLAICGNLADFMAENQPPKDAAELRRQKARALRELARLNGVLIDD